jgi:hypothetical protein
VRLALSVPSGFLRQAWTPITVTAEDASGTPAADYTGTVVITTSDGEDGDAVQGICATSYQVTCAYTFTAADAGSHTFMIEFSPLGPGIYSGPVSITVTDAALADPTASAKTYVAASGDTFQVTCGQTEPGQARNCAFLPMMSAAESGLWPYDMGVDVYYVGTVTISSSDSDFTPYQMSVGPYYQCDAYDELDDVPDPTPPGGRNPAIRLNMTGSGSMRAVL